MCKIQRGISGVTPGAGESERWRMARVLSLAYGVYSHR